MLPIIRSKDDNEDPDVISRLDAIRMTRPGRRHSTATVHTEQVSNMAQLTVGSSGFDKGKGGKGEPKKRRRHSVGSGSAFAAAVLAEGSVAGKDAVYATPSKHNGRRHSAIAP
jgi:hypothetical protein